MRACLVCSGQGFLVRAFSDSHACAQVVQGGASLVELNFQSGNFGKSGIGNGCGLRLPFLEHLCLGLCFCGELVQFEDFVFEFGVLGLVVVEVDGGVFQKGCLFSAKCVGFFQFGGHGSELLLFDVAERDDDSFLFGEIQSCLVECPSVERGFFFSLAGGERCVEVLDLGVELVHGGIPE